MTANCFKDRAAEGELKNASLHCLNDVCGWCGPSCDYQGHKLVCEFSLILYPFQKYGCTEKVLQKDLSGHMCVCSFSPTRCQWCSEWVQEIKVCRTARNRVFSRLKSICLIPAGSFEPENCPNYCGEKAML